MKTIVNKTRKVLELDLPSGRVLRLGPGETGQVSVHDSDHPPLRALVAAGKVQILDDS